MKLVTDEKILNQLNTDENSLFKPITDPNILNKLESKQSEFDPSFMSKLAPNILAGMAEMGHSLINAPSNIGRFAASKGFISPETANMIPRQQDYDYSAMLKLPGTTSDKIIQALAKNAPAMLMPEMKLGAIGKGIESIPMAGKSLSGAASRILPQAGWGAYTSENPYEGMKEFGLTQTALEGLKLPVSAAKGISEFMKPTQYAKNQLKEIKQGHDTAHSIVEETYRPVREMYDDFNVTLTPKKYLDFDKTQIKRFTPEVRASYEAFLKEPNFKNLHSLQSQMGRDYARISGNPNLINRADNLKLSRNIVNTKLINFLNRDPEALAQYKKAVDISRDLYYPYISNPTLRKISEGVKRDIKPKELSRALTKSKEKIVYKKEGKPITAIPEGHPLSETLNKLDTKISRGKAAQYAIPTLAASLMGGHFLPGVGHIGGGGAGALFAHYLQPHMIEFIQNPQVAKALKNYLEIPGQTIARGAVGYNIQNK
jgi:hypothetical protein